MRLVVALGNPGPRFQLTRHNYGWLVADRLEDEARITSRSRKPGYIALQAKHAGVGFTLARPLTYMNLSGAAVENLIRDFAHEPEDLIVAHDDLDIPFGELRVKDGGGDGGHKGLISIIRATGRSDFLRVRLGIAPPARPEDAAGYVLEPFSEVELRVLEGTVPRAAEVILDLLHDDPRRVMTRVNRRARKAEDQDKGAGGSPDGASSAT